MKMNALFTIAVVFPLVVCHAVEGVYDYPLGHDPLQAINSSLPMQAAVADIAGIGVVTHNDGTSVVVSVNTYWVGNPGSTNCLHITGADVLPAVTNAPIVFLASQYSGFVEVDPPTCKYAYIFDKADITNRYSAAGLFFISGERSWFNASATNFAQVAFTSNLVFAAQVSPSMQAFYELIRDGYRLYPKSSRIHTDSLAAFDLCEYYMPTNFMMTIWGDPLLTNIVRDSVANGYWIKTGSFPP
jgi:hypothetical protein